MPPPQPIPTFRQSVIPISCLTFRTQEKYFLSFKCLKVMVSLARIDGRFPITLPILHKSLSLASDLSLSPYELCLFRAMASLALYAFLRVGEMAATNNNKSLLSTDNIAKLFNASNHVVSLKVTFLHYKHSYNQPPFFGEHTTSVFFLPRPI